MSKITSIIDNIIGKVNTATSHIASSSNPHSVTKTQVGLGNVTNDAQVKTVTSTDNAVVRFDGTTGQVQNSGVTIDDNANVGIAITTSAYIGIPTIQVGKTAFLNGDGYVGDWGMSLSNNAAATGGAGFKYANPFQPSAYRQFEGSHFWYTASSGTAGNPITWNTAMTLGSNGNLLVGTTTDNGVDKLQVNGSIKAVGMITSRQSYNCKSQTKMINISQMTPANGFLIYINKLNGAELQCSMKITYQAYPGKSTYSVTSGFVYSNSIETESINNVLAAGVTPTVEGYQLGSIKTLGVRIPTTTKSLGYISVEATVGTEHAYADFLSDDFIVITTY